MSRTCYDTVFEKPTNIATLSYYSVIMLVLEFRSMAAYEVELFHAGLSESDAKLEDDTAENRYTIVDDAAPASIF